MAALPRDTIAGEKGIVIENHGDSQSPNLRLQSIAAISQSAIRMRDLTTFLEETVRAVTETLGVDCCSILEFLPDGRDLRLRAGAGCQERLAGHRCAAWSREQGLYGAIEVNIGESDCPWGLLAIHSARPGSFSAGEMDFVRSAANLVALAIHRGGTETAQPRSNELLQTIFDQGPVMISFREPSGQLLYVNRAWEQTLGWTLEEARSIDLSTLVEPDPEGELDVQTLIERCHRLWTDFHLRTRYGKSADISWARFRLSDDSIIGFGLDVTERREAERALADSEARFAKLFQASPVPLSISTIDDGRIIDVNESWLEMFGYSRDEVIGRTNAELSISAEPSRAEALRQVRAAGGTMRNLELKVRTKSGDLRDLMISTVAVVLNGDEETWLSAQIDITERKHAQAERDALLESELAARAEAESALEQLRAIESITDTALQNLDLDELLQELLARVRSALNADYTSVALVDERRHEIYLHTVVGHPCPSIRPVRSPLGHGVSGKVAADGRPRIEHDLATVDLSRVAGMSPSEILALSRSTVAAPLRVGSRIIGVVTAASPQVHHFNDDDLKLLLVVADRAAPAIERARLIETVREGRARLKALSARLLTAQEEERRRLAIELHDELGQVLTAVKINLQSAEKGSSPRGNLGDAIASVDQAMERVRGLALDLHPSVLDDLGLPAALRWYTDRFARDTGIEMRFSADAAHRLEPALETACFRVTQEALTNIMRHAQARQVWVDLHVGAGGTEVKIRDDGVGFDVAAARERAAAGVSLGLLGMEERVSSFDGELEVLSAHGNGTEIVARFRSAARV